MILQLFCVMVLIEVSGNAVAIDPLAGGLVTTNCFREKQTTPCKQSFLEAYLQTDIAQTDETDSEPDTHFFLFTRCNKEDPEFMHKCGGTLPPNTYFRSKRRTIFIVHGFLGSVCLSSTIREIKDQFLYRGNYNVILVDWPWGNQLEYYTASHKNAVMVGKQIAVLIQTITRLTGIMAKKIYIIGHSLGAQIAGMAGEHCQTLIGQKIGRITGLDPAGPGFHEDSPRGSLDSSDAEWVDIIHTNAGRCIPDMGNYRQLGHADFYPNGGSVQLSSYAASVESCFKGEAVYGVFTMIFSTAGFHVQSLQYFKTSINACDCQFIGVECSSYEEYKSGNCRDCGEDGSKCAVMGMDWEYYLRKKGNYSYYLDTSLLCPYCNNEGKNLRGFNETLRKRGCKTKCFTPSADV